jgi:membrane protein DedA with SNARE-associated domain
MTDWVFRLIEWGGYLGVFLLMFLETVFPPVPSEVIMPIAGMSRRRVR